MLRRSTPSRSSTRSAASTIASRLSGVRPVVLRGAGAQGGSGTSSARGSGGVVGVSISNGVYLLDQCSRRSYSGRCLNTVRGGDGVSADIEARGLVKTYKGPVRALDGVTLSVAPGTIF